MRLVATSEHRLWLDTADGFSKAMIRRHPSEECWAWALEWNTNFRVVGLFGDPAVADGIEASIPVLEQSVIGRTDGGELRSRLEKPLTAVDDTLFLSPAQESWSEQPARW